LRGEKDAGQMPVVFRSGGFTFFFYSNEGDPREPIHIHVRKGDGDAKFWISPIALGSSNGFDARILRELARLVEANSALIERAWHEHFG
jgi:Domain of unknown function (DUF4160)